jgi:hypothetical protein
MITAQATRTWVSGVGDDANPCSRTAPCKTFAGAISKTANGGEINCLDPGGFGGVTITKSLTIKCQYTEGGVLVAGTNAIVIAATATDKVTLRGLDINGTGVGAPVSLVGVKVISAATVQIFDSEITQFKVGVDVASTTATATRVYINNTHIHNNGVGVIVAPGSNAATAGNFATIRGSQIVDNACNLVAAGFGTNGTTPDSNTNCGAALNGSGINQRAVLSVFDSGIADATNTAALAKGPGATTILRLGDNYVTGNALGVVLQDGGAFVSFGDNDINGNGASAAPTTVAAHT